MKDKRRHDPLQRTPPTIDLKADVVPPTADPAATPSVDEAATAVEPVASTGLGSDPFPKEVAPVDEQARENGSPEIEPLGEPTNEGMRAGADAQAALNEGSSVSDVPTDGPTVDAREAEVVPAPEPFHSEGTVSPEEPPAQVPPAAVAAQSNARGAGSGLTAGLVGGLLGAVIALAVPRILPLPPERGVEDRLEEIAKSGTAPASGTDTLAPRLSKLETSVAQASDEARAARNAANAATKQAAEAVGRPAPAAGAQPAPDAPSRQDVQALGSRIDAITEKATASANAVDEVGKRLSGQVQSATERLDGVARDVETLATQQKSLQSDVATLRSGSATFATRLGDADRRLTTNAETISRVSDELAKLSPAAVQAGLRVVVSGRLDDALRSGRPLGPAISTLTKLGVDAGALAALKPYAESAAPTPTALAAEFRSVAEQMTAVPPKPNETWSDAGRRILGKIVTVEAVGDGSDEDLPGLVARIDASLARGDVVAAKAAWDKLPADKRARASRFGDTLAARAAAEDAARRIASTSLAALDAATR